METIEVLGKTYEVIEVIPKKHSEYDLFVCKAPEGYKECFQRIDLGQKQKIVRMSESVQWTYDELEIVKEALKNGKTATEISKYEQLNRHTQNAIYVRANELKSKMKLEKQIEEERKHEPRFNIKF